MNMFFQTRAETVGMTKKGAITMMRMTPWPNIGRSSKSAKPTPPMVVMQRMPPTMTSVVCTLGQKELDETNRA